MERSVLVSASYDHSIRVWSLEMGEQLATIPHGEAQVNSMALTPDGRQLAVASWQRIRLYDILAQNISNPIVAFDKVAKNVTAIGFIAEGRWMYTGGEDCSCRVYDMRANQLHCQKIFETSSAVTSVIPNHNQYELLVADAGGNVYVWDLRMGQHETLPGRCAPQEYIVRLTLHPTGRLLAGISNKGRVHWWDVCSSAPSAGEEWTAGNDGRCETSGQARDTIQVHNTYGLACRWSPDGRQLATTSADSMCRVLDWDGLRLRPRGAVNAGPWVWDCAWNNDSRYLVTGGATGALQLWDTCDMKEGKEKRPMRSYEGHPKPVTALIIRDLA